MALPEMVAAPASAPTPDSTHYAGEQPCSGGGFKPEMPQDLLVVDDAIAGNGVAKKGDAVADAGFSIKTAGWEDSMDSALNPQAVVPENGQPMLYTAGYGPPQSNNVSQPQGHYVSNMGMGPPSYGPHYGHYYQQVVPQSGMQYYPVGQDATKNGNKKSAPKETSQNQKVKSGGNQTKQGYQTGQRPIDTSNEWCVYPGMGNGGFYCDFYSQQWHSSARGFQPIPPPQPNLGLPGSGVPPAHGGQYQNFSRVHCTPNANGRILKGSSLKSGSNGANWRAKDATKSQPKGDVPANNVLTEACAEQFQKYLNVKPKVNPASGGHLVDGYDFLPDNQTCSVNRSDYNKEDFQVCHESAKFFIIKSYSEDDVHKSIKYNVWSSTPNGNKRLDEAYRKAQEKAETSSTPCPVFFFFSVNCSGQFCGVAEMVGPVDFNTNMDFWLQGKWNGCLPVKWHIIKDVPNGHFRHIILSNNDNKPVTHSRDTQEVHFHQGLEMLKIFKHFPIRTSLLDDFAFYDNRQKILQERKSKQQQRHQVVKQAKDRATEKNGNAVTNDSKEKEKNGDQVTNEIKGDNIQCNINKLQLEDGVDSGTETEKVKLPQKITSASEGDIEVLESSEKLQEEKMYKPKVTDSETTVTSKDDVARLPVNYKKALLGGMQGKAVTVDPQVGA